MQRRFTVKVSRKRVGSAPEPTGISFLKPVTSENANYDEMPIAYYVQLVDARLGAPKLRVRFWPRLCKNVQLLLCHSRVAFTIAIESL